jgi:hypothetical protein
MIFLDANDLSIRTIKLRLASDKCPACGPNPSEKLPYYVEMCGEVKLKIFYKPSKDINFSIE